MRLTNAQKIYRTIQNGNHGRDVVFIANVILTSCTKPTTKLRNLMNRLNAGQEVRCGNTIDSIRINGDYHFGLSVLDK